ncbi:MAG: YebC/PmpR family DNA-binding transcriptional regulator [Epsilonproteobacteria bacterium]|nr:MAG: YebC/PmpR family DNA-binding transcriptional regulator [Campylobacterota bacterium]
MGRAFEYRKASKLKRWGNMSRVFPKLAKAITMAAKQGVPDPDMNAPLRTAIANAKAQNLPKENIVSAIKRATAKDCANLIEINYEGKSAHGVLVFVECATDNTARTVAHIKDIFKKSKGVVVPTGSLEYMFDRKSVFEIGLVDDIDELELSMIDYGWESYEVDDDTIYITGDFKDFGNLNDGLHKLDITVQKATLQRVPNNPQDITDEAMNDLELLIDKLEENEDVQAVWTNIL